MSKKGMATRAVHDGDRSLRYEGAINTPIFQSSTFSFPTDDPRTWEGEVPRGTYIYSRNSNPTVEAVEEKLASLEGAEASLAFSSGMAAISTALLAFVGKGDRVVAMQDLYGGTYGLLRNEMPRLGVDVAFVPTTDPEELCAAIDGRTKVLYLESPTNPLLKLIDIKETCRLAHEKGCRVLIDNTFATPVLQRPLEQGVDVVLQAGVPWRPRRQAAGPRGEVPPGQQWIYLVAQDGIDCGLFDTLAQRLDAPRGPADGGARGYLQGEALQQWLQLLQAALAATRATAG